MSDSWATGSRAFGFCDRCAQRYQLSELAFQIINKRNSGLKVCPECLDIDQEQLRLGEVDSSDPQSLRDPRPDTSQISSQTMFGWNPIGNSLTKISGKTGSLT